MSCQDRVIEAQQLLINHSSVSHDYVRDLLDALRNIDWHTSSSIEAALRPYLLLLCNPPLCREEGKSRETARTLSPLHPTRSGPCPVVDSDGFTLPGL